MKKNLLSVLILVLLIVNIVLSAVMMTNVISTNKKTAELMVSIGTAMNLELYTPGEGPEVSLTDTDTHVMGQMTILLAGSGSEDGSAKTKQTYLVFEISLLMDKTHEDYAEFGEKVKAGEFDSIITNKVEQVVSRYTEEECRASFTEDIRNEMLTAIQEQFQSRFIYGITLSGIKYGGG